MPIKFRIRTTREKLQENAIKIILKIKKWRIPYDKYIIITFKPETLLYLKSCVILFCDPDGDGRMHMKRGDRDVKDRENKFKRRKAGKS